MNVGHIQSAVQTWDMPVYGRFFSQFLLRFPADNWALIRAQQLAAKESLPLHVCFCLVVPKSELSTLRHYSFLLKGLEEVQKVFTATTTQYSYLLHINTHIHTVMFPFFALKELHL